MDAQIDKNPEGRHWLLLEMDEEIRECRLEVVNAIAGIFIARFKAQQALIGEAIDPQTIELLEIKTASQAEKEFQNIQDDLRRHKASAGVTNADQLAEFAKQPSKAVLCVAKIVVAYISEAKESLSKCEKDFDANAMPSTFHDFRRAIKRANYLNGVIDGISEVIETPTASEVQRAQAKKGASGRTKIYGPSKEKARLLLVTEFERLVRMISGADLPRVFRGKEHALKSIVKELVKFHGIQNQQNGNDHLSVHEQTVLKTLGRWFSKATLLEMAQDALKAAK